MKMLSFYEHTEKTTGGVLLKKLSLKISQYSQEKAFVGVSTKVFSCEYFEIFKNPYFEDLQMIASE